MEIWSEVWRGIQYMLMGMGTAALLIFWRWNYLLGKIIKEQEEEKLPEE